MRVKTKSGFTCIVDENKIKDWRYVKAAASAAKGDEANAIANIVYMVNFLLGDKDEQRLVEHVTGKDGIADATRIQAEFEEITRLMGEHLKKSESSQA